VKKITERFIALAFIVIIIGLGAGTFLNVKDDILDVLKKDESAAEVTTEIETQLADNFKGRHHWININGLFLRGIGKRIVEDPGDIDVYKMDNGKLTYAYPDVDMSDAASNTVEFAKAVEEKGATFIYVQLPCKVYDDELMPPGTHSYADSTSDYILDALEAENIKTLDLRDYLYEQEEESGDIFFNTDHHWKPSAALQAAGIITEELGDAVEGFYVDEECLNEDNFNVEVYEDKLLGSLGRRTGKYYGGTDDFELITPKYETDFNLYTEKQNSGKKGEREGDFTKALLKTNYLERNDLFDEMTYFTYIGGEYRKAVVTNNMTQNSNKILMLRDSFSCTLLPFLSLACNQITAVDLRYHDNPELMQIIEDEDIDTVLVVYNPSMFREDGAFDFFK